MWFNSSANQIFMHAVSSSFQMLECLVHRICTFDLVVRSFRMRLPNGLDFCQDAPMVGLNNLIFWETSGYFIPASNTLCNHRFLPCRARRV